jgi:hypothetical protein
MTSAWQFGAPWRRQKPRAAAKPTIQVKSNTLGKGSGTAVNVAARMGPANGVLPSMLASPKMSKNLLTSKGPSNEGAVMLVTPVLGMFGFISASNVWP